MVPAEAVAIALAATSGVSFLAGFVTRALVSRRRRRSARVVHRSMLADGVVLARARSPSDYAFVQALDNSLAEALASRADPRRREITEGLPLTGARAAVVDLQERLRAMPAAATVREETAGPAESLQQGERDLRRSVL